MNEEVTNELSTSSTPAGERDSSATQADAGQTPAPETTEAQAATDSAPTGEPATGPAEPSAATGAPAMRIAVSALSDVGCVRTNNEDFYGYDELLGIFVICDGMGGMASGEVASSRTVAAILKSYAESAGLGCPSAADFCLPSTRKSGRLGERAGSGNKRNGNDGSGGRAGWRKS